MNADAEDTTRGGAGIPEPPWLQRPEGQKAGRAPLTRETVVEGALRVLDREGLNGFSMRALGQELGTGAASIYWHVRNKSELLNLVLDRVIAEVRVPAPDPSRWQEQVKDFAREMRRALGRHRDVARLTLGQIPTGPNAVNAAEGGLAILKAAKLPDRTCAYTLDLLGLYVGATSVEEDMGLQSPTGEDLSPEETMGMIRDYWESLPVDRFPNLRGLLGELIDGDGDDRFEWGLDVIVKGLAATAE